jgi:hypothetical protein
LAPPRWYLRPPPLTQERGAFAWGTLAALFTISLAVVAEMALVLFIFFPADIAGVRTADQHFPFFPWHVLDHSD